MKPGSKCPSCRAAVKYGNNVFDEAGNVVCAFCKGIVFPVTEEAHKAIFTKMPVYETQYNRKDFELNPVNN